MHRFDPNNMKKLDSEERRAAFRAGEILLMAGLKNGMAVADIGCGTGFFALEASRMAGPGGLVYALDLQEPMLAELRKRIAANNVLNITPVLTEEYGFMLPEEAVDMAFMAFVLHEIEDKGRFLAEAGRILKKGGRLSVLEWKKAKTEKGPPPAGRIGEEEAGALLTRAGFSDVRIREYNSDAYLAIAAK